MNSLFALLLLLPHTVSTATPFTPFTDSDLSSLLPSSVFPSPPLLYLIAIDPPPAHLTDLVTRALTASATNYRLRSLSCQAYPTLCEHLHLTHASGTSLTFVQPTGKRLEHWRYTSPFTAEHVRYKLKRMLEQTVEVVEGTVEDVWGMPEVAEEGRRVVVMEAGGQVSAEKYETAAKKYKEQVKAVRVNVAHKGYEMENENYQNVYVVGPDRYIQRYLVPVNP